MLRFFLVGILSFATQAQAQEHWPQFRGSSHGASINSGPTQINPDKPLWKTAIPEGTSSPCIWADNIFLTAANKTNSELQTLCLDRWIAAKKNSAN